MSAAASSIPFPELIDRKVAELYGWQEIEQSGVLLIGVPPSLHHPAEEIGVWTPRFEIPQYSQDVREILQVIQSLPDEEYILFSLSLNEILAQDLQGPTTQVKILRAVGATALQLCRAYIKYKSPSSV